MNPEETPGDPSGTPGDSRRAPGDGRRPPQIPGDPHDFCILKLWLFDHFDAPRAQRIFTCVCGGDGFFHDGSLRDLSRGTLGDSWRSRDGLLGFSWVLWGLPHRRVSPRVGKPASRSVKRSQCRSSNSAEKYYKIGCFDIDVYDYDSFCEA